MPYIEANPSRRHFVLLLALVPLLYGLRLGTRELGSNEALQAVICSELHHHWQPLITTVQGEQIPSFPLYPCLAGIASGFREPTEWTTRLPAVLSTVLLAGLAAAVAAEAGGSLAGVVAAAVVLTSLISFREGTRADSDMLFALLLNAAWFAWFRLGRGARRWVAAWFWSLFFVFLACFNVGARALACFYLPFFFLRRPMRAWRRMLIPAHLVGLVLLGGVLSAWLLRFPEQVFLPWNSILGRAAEGRPAGYLAHLCLFPLKAGWYLLPWTLVAWPGFCLAHRRLEKVPVLCHYLRTICVSLFVAAWLLPQTSPRALLPLLGPVAILTGLHFEILVRRHQGTLRQISRLVAWLALVGAGAGFLLGVLHIIGVVVWSGLDPLRLGIMMVLLLAAALGAYLLLTRGRTCVCWLALVLAVTAARLAYLAAIPPMAAHIGGERRLLGQQLVQAVPPTATVYSTVSEVFVAVGFYVDRPIRAIIDPAQELPAEASSVYVLSGRKAPILAARTWTPCSPPVDPRLRHRAHIRWFPGERCLARIEIKPELPDGRRPLVVLRMYRGDLRN